MNKFYVYVHRRLSDNKPFYVGKGKGNRAYSLSGRNDYWKNTAKKHGFSVELVFEELNEEDAFQCEKDTILEFKYFGYPLTNLTDGGEGTSGYKQSAETRKLISDSITGLKRSDETKQKISDAFKGVKRSENAVIKTAKSNTGKRRTDSTRKLMSLLAKQRASESDLSAKMTGMNNPSASHEIHKFVNIKTGEMFVGTRIQLCDRYNINPSTLRNLFGNRRKSAAGWSLLKEEDAKQI